MAGPEDMILPMLREMRAENKALHHETSERLGVVERRLQMLEEAQRSFKQALTADSLLSKLVTGEFEQRIAALEAKFAIFEGRKT